MLFCSLAGGGACSVWDEAEDLPPDLASPIAIPEWWASYCGGGGSAQPRIISYLCHELASILRQCEVLQTADGGGNNGLPPRH